MNLFLDYPIVVFSLQYVDFQEAQEALSPNQAKLLALEVM
jgi:hypothetical protein